MYQRINVTLPEATVKLLDKVTSKGDRSSLIDDAVHLYIQHIGKENLRRRLKEGAIKTASRDQHIASEWFSLKDRYAK